MQFLLELFVSIPMFDQSSVFINSSLLFSDYIYPYIILIGSVISIAVHYSHHIDQSPVHLLQSSLHFRNFSIVFFHWSLHAFGIISLTELKRSTDFLFFLLIPFPTFFYILTAKFTDPTGL